MIQSEGCGERVFSTIETSLERDLTASTGQRPELPKALQGGREWFIGGSLLGDMFVFKIWNCIIPIPNLYFRLIGFLEYDQVLLHTPCCG